MAQDTAQEGESQLSPASDPPSLADIDAARDTIDQYLPTTPVVKSDWLSSELDAEVYLKREDVLPTGAFKVRGGMNFAANLDRSAHTALITASTGNHGQSIAYAGAQFDIPVTIVVPNGANPRKVEAIERYGATVESHGDDMDAACAFANRRADEQGYRFVHPANEPLLIAGVATAGLEIVEQLPTTDVLCCPVGGGSSSSGYCLTVGRLLDAAVIGVQAAGADATYQAWHTGGTTRATIETFAEGLAVGEAFSLPVQILKNRLTDLLRVDDDELWKAMRDLLAAESIIAEGASAAGIAGVRHSQESMAGKTVVVPISGRNLSVEKLHSLTESITES